MPPSDEPDQPALIALIALYETLGEQLRHARNEQWRSVAFIIAGMFGINSVITPETLHQNGPLLKTALTLYFLVLVVIGCWLISILQQRVKDNQNVRRATERALGFHKWKPFTDHFILIRSETRPFWMDLPELIGWHGALVLGAVFNLVLIWQ